MSRRLMAASRLTLRRPPVLLGSALGLFLFAGWLGWGRTTDLAHAGGFDALPSPPQRLPVGDPTPPGAQPSIEWLGHAGFLVRWHDLAIVLDPNLSSRCTVAPRRWPVPDEAAEALADLPIAAALISHGHFDHLDLPTLRQIAPLRIVVPEGAGRYVSQLDATIDELAMSAGPLRLRTVTAQSGGPQGPDVLVHAVPTAHNGNRLHPFAGPAVAVGYIVQRGDFSLYFAGDTGRAAPFEEIARRFRPTIALLPIGAYAPRWPLGRYHLAPEEAAEIARALGDPLVVPMHFGTFRLSLDAPRSALPRFAAAAERLGVHWALAPPVPQLIGASDLADRPDRHGG